MITLSKQKRTNNATVNVRMQLTDDEVAALHASGINGDTLSEKMTGLVTRVVESWFKNQQKPAQKPEIKKAA